MLEAGEKYAEMWGVETALSAGIAALELLDAAGREKAVKMARAVPDVPARTTIEILSPDKQELLNRLREELGTGDFDKNHQNQLREMLEGVKAQSKAGKGRGKPTSAKFA